MRSQFVRGCTPAAAALVLALPLMARAEQAPAGTTSKLVEIRSYNLKPGTRDRFHQLFLTAALPMLQRWHVDVVAFGASLHDKDSYFLMRGFPGVDDRQKSEDAFYGSEEWIKGPRERVLADIVNYTTVVINVDAATLRGLRASGGMAMKDDLAQLTKLNDDYIQSVQKGDVKRFAEILSDDFLCTQSDGTLLDRKQFLEATARPVTISNLKAHDVNVRIMGDTAIVHARTSFTMADGRQGTGRYTDVWGRRGGQWLAVAAHVTRK